METETEKKKKKKKKKKQPFFKRVFPGWRGGIALNVTMIGIVLLVNVIILIWAKAKFPFHNGLAPIFSGGCTTAKYASVAGHLVINILSTLLLSASNYAMQVASSPSRADVDRAHQKQNWLDVGLVSLRNFRWISRYRLLAYGVLLLSSIPLHFIYNSVLSQSLATIDECVVLIVTPEYFTDSALPHAPPLDASLALQSLAAKVRTRADAGQLKNIGVGQCNATLSSDLQSDYESLVFVQISVPSTNSTLLEIYFDGNNEGFIPDYQLTECWAGVLEAECQLFLNSWLLAGVIVANIIKVGVMIIMLLKFTRPSLVTIGDAISSFLAIEDSTTVGLRSVEKHRKHRSIWVYQESVVYIRVQKRWSASPSRLKWGFSISMCIIFVLTAGGMLALALVDLGLNNSSFPYDPRKWSVWSLGFGKPSNFATIYLSGDPVLLPPDGNPLSLILLANTPQFVLSVGYLLINNLLTDMLGAREWSKIGHTKTKLRTSDPQGQQRSTYFLQLPYKYSLPLMVIMSSLHYVLSMSLFVVNISAWSFDADGNLYATTYKRYKTVKPGWLLNFSPLGIICTLVVSIFLIALPIVLGFRKLDPEIPMARACSALISAACHPGPDEGNAGLLPVQWGVIEGSAHLETGVEHCSISSKQTSGPVEGQLYS